MSKNLRATIVTSDMPGKSNITVFLVSDPTTLHGPVNDTHPAWDEIFEGVLNDDPSVVDLFDLNKAIGQRHLLSERVSVAGNHLLLDNDVIEGPLVDYIVNSIGKGEDAQPFVTLLEKIEQNPSEHSRQQLWSFLRANAFATTPDGYIIGYKGVNKGCSNPPPTHFRRPPNSTSVTGPQYYSTHSGPGIVNGDPHGANNYEGGPVPQNDGDVVEMARSEVDPNHFQACSTGLHVGTWGHANGFGNTRIAVLVHPRDVVSVPSQDETKVRVCRYKIIGEISEPYKGAVVDLNAVPDTPTEVFTQTDAATHLGYVSELTRDGKPIKHPSAAKFNQLRLTAKAQKKGLERYMTNKGYVRIGDDPQSRKSWCV